MSEIPAIHKWQSNGHLIADVAKLHLKDVSTVFDATYGRGTWWSEWKPKNLVTNDLWVEADHRDDFTNLPWKNKEWECVAYDPPYKLAGTPKMADMDARFGITPMSWKDRWDMIFDGLEEAFRVTNRICLVKGQDQVCSGEMRWMTHYMIRGGDRYGFRLVDRFDYIGKSIPQPRGRNQVHARGRGSTLLVFKR